MRAHRKEVAFRDSTELNDSTGEALGESIEIFMKSTKEFTKRKGVRPTYVPASIPGLKRKIEAFCKSAV